VQLVFALLHRDAERARVRDADDVAGQLEGRASSASQATEIIQLLPGPGSGFPL
jgi:hypothetical protein